ncbi:hypothetical protein Cadr_000015818 [Camelus dromedarius]|uniref:Uncharacterized protein n=1 Tax=Camelus dromedarius TaxID=9838 RepID=A0A5N4E977_CAMDR|nr:hypothetical protein Cadr_000015818 [Camelus dromedarius]
MGRQLEPETLLRFPALPIAGLEAVMDLGNGCFAAGGHVRCRASELLCWRCHQRETEEKTKLISILNSLIMSLRLIGTLHTTPMPYTKKERGYP